MARTQWSIRQATEEDAAAIAKVHVDSWRTTYRGIVPDHFLDGMSYESSEARWRRVSREQEHGYAMFIAEDVNGNVVGFANGGRERSRTTDYDGELYAIYLLESHQRQGIGRALFRNIGQHLTVNGFTSMLIWVLAENPSCKFYESMGGIPMLEQEIEIGGKRLREIGYGWTSIH